MWTALTLLLACHSSPEGGGRSPASSTLAAVDDPSVGPNSGTVFRDADPCAEPGSWSRTGHPFMLTWCTGCHSQGREGDARYGAPESVNLDSLADAVAWQDRILARVSAGTMPPGGGPSEQERERLALWFSCGAPGTAATIEGSAPEFVRVDGTAVVAATRESTNWPGALDWGLHEGDPYSGVLGMARMVETYDVSGMDAWLVERVSRAGNGVVLKTWTWDPPMQVSQAGATSWSVETEVTEVDESGVAHTEMQEWSFERVFGASPDAWSIDSNPGRIVGLEASGGEEGWDVSDRFGLSARWAYDAAGEGFEAQQALAQDSADFSGVFPLLSGDRRAGRMLRIEVAP